LGWLSIGFLPERHAGQQIFDAPVDGQGGILVGNGWRRCRLGAQPDADEGGNGEGQEQQSQFRGHE
jgi:hypothetical protein